jgi:iron complex outermembrane receptor protein
MYHFTRILTVILFLGLSVQAQAQRNSSIKGKVVTADGYPAVAVSVTLKGEAISTQSNVDGLYQFTKLKPGTYLVVVSALGLKSDERSITLGNNDDQVANFRLSEKSDQLKEVVIGGKVKRYKVDVPSTSLRLNAPLLEIPQNIQIVSGQTLADQQVISMSDALVRNVSGATRVEHWGDMYTNITMRGSQIQAMRNGFNFVTSFWGPLTEDMSFVDHVEFVKGPAGFMLGNGDPSGMYNVVTKKPTGSNRGEVSFTAGSYDLYRTAFDLDRKLTDDGKLLFRFNAAVQNKGSFRPFEHNDRYTIAPTLSYQITNTTKITAEYAYQNAKMTEVGSYYLFSPNGYATLPRDLTLTQPGVDPTRMNDHSAFLNLQHNFSDNWKATAQVAYSKYLQTGNSSWPSSIFADGTMIRNVGVWDADATMKLAQFFLNGKIKTGGITHNILTGFDGGKKNYYADFYQSHDLDLPTAPFDVNNPNYGFPGNGYPNFDRSRSVKERAIAAGGVIDQKYSSVYLQDELAFFDNKARLTLAGRYSYVNQSTYGAEADKAERFTPRLGLSVSLDKNASVYGVYDQAFIPQSGFLRNGDKADPITGSNYELGIKKDWMNGKWNTTVSVYRIRKQNELTGDPSNKAGENFSIVVGEKRAQGIEFDLKGELAKGLSLIANYAYTDGKVTEVAEGAATPVFFVGQVVPGFAKHTSNAWLSYTIQSGTLKGAGISSGFTYLVDRATNTYNPNQSEQNLPDYFKLDAGLFWEGHGLRITGNVFNVLDKYLYSGGYYTNYWNAPTYEQPAYSWQAEAPRNYRVSIAYKF